MIIFEFIPSVVSQSIKYLNIFNSNMTVFPHPVGAETTSELSDENIFENKMRYSIVYFIAKSSLNVIEVNEVKYIVIFVREILFHT